MRALAVFPAARELRVVERPEPELRSPSDVRLRMLEVGVCATDRDLAMFRFGDPPPGSDHFILGHESLAEVVEAGPGAAGWAPGDLAVIVVRHPCGPPACSPCAAGRQDFCASGGYREHGIKELDGFLCESIVVDAAWLCPVPRSLRSIAVLTEPLTIAEKALAQREAIAGRLPWREQRRTAAVLGAGPVGLLGALLLRHQGWETWIYSREKECPLADAIGAHYVSTAEATPDRFAALAGPIDFVYEAMGAPQLAYDVLPHLGANGLFVFTGAPWPGQQIALDLQRTALAMVIRNLAVAGTVNAAPGHFADAIAHLQAFERRWPGAAGRILNGRFPLEGYRDALFAPAGLKQVIEL